MCTCSLGHLDHLLWLHGSDNEVLQDWELSVCLASCIDWTPICQFASEDIIMISKGPLVNVTISSIIGKWWVKPDAEGFTRVKTCMMWSQSIGLILIMGVLEGFNMRELKDLLWTVLMLQMFSMGSKHLRCSWKTTLWWKPMIMAWVWTYTFTTGSTYTVTIVPIHGRSSFCILLVATLMC
jgi:hypothetical protein